MMFYQVLSFISLAVLAAAQTQASFDGTALTFTFSGGGSTYDGTSNYQITRIETVGTGYWVTSQTASTTGADFIGYLQHDATALSVVPNSAIPSNSSLTVSFEGALIDTPPANGVSHFSTLWTVWYQPIAGGNSVSRTFDSTVDVNWGNYPNAMPLMAKSVQKTGTVTFTKRDYEPKVVKRWTPEPTTLATVNSEVGIYTAKYVNATF